ncbi:hypothetical protein IQ07DRAFT_222144 [Pyrenochaeta sp. DS3sAY3a]|nr:hypothetical protein IQ07DRAFT_222144 [Pyrenochaeta sp. DS3sAY3a]
MRPPPLRPVFPSLTLLPLRRAFSLLPPTQRSHTNRIFTPIRTPSDLHTLLLLNAADNRALITLWTTSYCSTCATVAPLLRALIEDERVGEREGGLGFVQVPLDGMEIGDLGVTYRITSIPTLLAFSRQEAQFDTKLTRPEDMKDREVLREWLVEQARRGGRRGGGGGKMFGL